MAKAAELFDHAVAASPLHKLPMGLSAFQSQDLLLTLPEHAAIRVALGFYLAEAPSEEEARQRALSICETVAGLSRESLTFAEQTGVPVFSALASLTAAKAALYTSILEGESDREQSVETATNSLAYAEGMFTAGGIIEFRPLLLLTRAWLSAHTRCDENAVADLNEAWQIASRGDMRLILTDIFLHRARLFHTSRSYPWDNGGRTAEDDLFDARDLIQQCNYWRRKAELEMTDAAIEASLY